MINVTNCGHDSRHKTKFCMTRKTGVPNYILLLVKTDAIFEIDGKLITTNPNMVIMFDRNTYMNYGCDKDYYNDDWIHFDFIQEPSLLDSLNIPFNQPIYLPQVNHLSNYIRLMVQEMHFPSYHKKQIIDSIMRSLLYSLDSQIAQLSSSVIHHKHYQTMNQLRMNIYNSPNKKWTVDSMADYVHLSPYYLQHIYKDIFHTSCTQEVIQARLERAKFYLTTTDMTIKELSDYCGYDNDLHFIRQFKKKEGMTPTRYRDLYRPKI
ncbi:MAG TPA: AraC family transcriptional regulator [Mobilitalea sp.]|nr:AraC family transcriptional regulator [Mobilitalea sp.]